MAKAPDDPEKIKQENAELLARVKEYLLKVTPKEAGAEGNAEDDLQTKNHYLILKIQTHYPFFDDLSEEERKAMLDGLTLRGHILEGLYNPMKELQEKIEALAKDPTKKMKGSRLEKEFLEYKKFLDGMETWLSDPLNNPHIGSNERFNFERLQTLPKPPAPLIIERKKEEARQRKPSLTDADVDKIIAKHSGAGSTVGAVSTTSFVLSTVGNVAVKLGDAFSFSSKLFFWLPPAAFVLIPLSNAFKTAGYATWRFAVGQDATQNQDPEVQKAIKYINKKNKRSSYAGFVGGIAILTGVLSPVAAPIAFVVGFPALLISNLYWSAGVYRDWQKEANSSKQDSARSARLWMHRGNFVYASFSTTSSVFFAVAAVLALAFPPAALVVAAPFAIAGAVTTAICVAGFISSTIASIAASKKEAAEAKAKAGVAAAPKEEPKAGLKVDEKLAQGAKLAEKEAAKEALITGAKPPEKETHQQALINQLQQLQSQITHLKPSDAKAAEKSGAVLPGAAPSGSLPSAIPSGPLEKEPKAKKSDAAIGVAEITIELPKKEAGTLSPAQKKPSSDLSEQEPPHPAGKEPLPKAETKTPSEAKKPEEPEPPSRHKPS